MNNRLRIGSPHGIPFEYIIPLVELKTLNLSNSLIMEMTGKNLEVWATSRFKDPTMITIKESKTSLTSKFKDGSSQTVLLIEGCLYGEYFGPGSFDQKTIEAIDVAMQDLETFIKTGTSPQIEALRKAEAERLKKLKLIGGL